MIIDNNRYYFLGIDVDALTVNKLNRIIGEVVREGKKCIIANHNIHSIYLHHRVPKMEDLYKQADYTHIDGMSLIFLGRLLGFPLEAHNRVTYVDWISPLLQDAQEQGWKVFYLGARPEVVETGAERIQSEYPEVEFAYHHGYFDAHPDSSENQEVLELVNTFSPNVLMVGMGMPRQEKWIVDNLDEINANVILPSGACIDYIAEAVPTPPRWTGRFGLEWLYRFFQEPRRLWYRHFIEPLPILLRFVRDFIRIRILRS